VNPNRKMRTTRADRRDHGEQEAQLSAERPIPSLLVQAAGDRDRGLGLGPGAAHVEAAVADGDVVAAEQAHALDAAGRARHHVVFRQREDDRGGACDQVDEGRFWLAVGLGEQLVGEIAPGAAERDLPGAGVRQIDQVGGGLADPHSVDLVLELGGKVVAAVGARGRGGECGEQRQRGEYRASNQVSCHEYPRAIEACAEDSCKRAAATAIAITAVV